MKQPHRCHKRRGGLGGWEEGGKFLLPEGSWQLHPLKTALLDQRYTLAVGTQVQHAYIMLCEPPHLPHRLSTSWIQVYLNKAVYLSVQWLKHGGLHDDNMPLHWIVYQMPMPHSPDVDIMCREHPQRTRCHPREMSISKACIIHKLLLLPTGDGGPKKGNNRCQESAHILSNATYWSLLRMDLKWHHVTFLGCIFSTSCSRVLLAQVFTGL